MKYRRKKNNFGFTLVELIVVLVILAILAAILVPSLIGYIDRAKYNQIILNARSSLMAAQAELSEMYGNDDDWTSGNTDNNNTPDPTGYYYAYQESTHAKNIMDTADVPNCTLFLISCDSRMTSGDRSAYIINFAYYSEGNQSVYFDGSSWNITTDSWINLAPSDTPIYYIYLETY